MPDRPAKTCGAQCPDMDGSCDLAPGHAGPEHMYRTNTYVVRWPVRQTSRKATTDA
jgi:hypothetical protein